jgi:hypothetical protein
LSTRIRRSNVHLKHCCSAEKKSKKERSGTGEEDVEKIIAEFMRAEAAHAAGNSAPIVLFLSI